MQRRTRQKETPPPLLVTRLAQLLQIPHLADRRAPLHEQPLVQAPTTLHWRRPGLEGDRVARDGGEVVLVEPAHRGLVVGQADGEGCVLGAGFAGGGVGLAGI